jgi:hypothetical protein
MLGARERESEVGDGWRWTRVGLKRCVPERGVECAVMWCVWEDMMRSWLLSSLTSEQGDELRIQIRKRWQ